MIFCHCISTQIGMKKCKTRLFSISYNLKLVKSIGRLDAQGLKNEFMFAGTALTSNVKEILNMMLPFLQDWFCLYHCTIIYKCDLARGEHYVTCSLVIFAQRRDITEMSIIAQQRILQCTLKKKKNELRLNPSPVNTNNF